MQRLAKQKEINKDALIRLSPNENKVSDGGYRRKTIRRECVIIALGKPGAWNGIQEGVWLA
jgi:hypothetical protein